VTYTSNAPSVRFGREVGKAFHTDPGNLDSVAFFNRALARLPATATVDPMDAFVTFTIEHLLLASDAGREAAA
jgi:hypothetical protein